MATFLVTDPDSGRKVRLTGDSPPTEAELTQIFAGLPPVVDLPVGGVGAAAGDPREAMLSLASSAASIIPSGLAGVAGAIGGLVPGGETPGEKGARFVEETQEALTFQPRTQAGQETLTAVGEAIESTGIPQALVGSAKDIGRVGAVLGGPFPAVGAAIGETLPTAVGLGLAAPGAIVRFSKPSPTKQKIVDLIESGSTDIDTARFKVVEGALVKDPKAVEAIKQGFDEAVIPDIKQSSLETKVKMRRMVTIVERGKKNRRFRDLNRASDVAGDSLMQRVRIINRSNKEAGSSLDVVARSLEGKRVDLAGPLDNFAQGLDNLGVKLVSDGKGGFKPDFELSDLAPGDRAPVREVIRQMNIKGRGSIDGLSAHRMKRAIDNNVTFGKSKTGISGDAESLLKGFRRDIDGALDTTFPEYNRVNVAYSETINALNELQDAVGKKLDLRGPNADKATGTALRKLLSNSQGRVNLLDSINEIERTAKKFEGFTGKIDPRAIEGPGFSSIKDDLFSQITFVDELDSVFGSGARTSFKGQIEQAITQVARPRGVVERAADVAVKGIEASRGINDAGAFKAIKRLLSE